MPAAGIQFAVLRPRSCVSCKRKDPPELAGFPPLGEHALLCRDCCRRPEYELITKTDALNKFKLMDHDLKDLAFVKRMNKGRFFMKLFLLSQVKQKASAKQAMEQTIVKPNVVSSIAQTDQEVIDAVAETAATCEVQVNENSKPAVATLNPSALKSDEAGISPNQEQRKGETEVFKSERWGRESRKKGQDHGGKSIITVPSNSHMKRGRLRQTTLQGVFQRNTVSSASDPPKHGMVPMALSEIQMEPARPLGHDAGKGGITRKRNVDAREHDDTTKAVATQEERTTGEGVRESILSLADDGRIGKTTSLAGQEQEIPGRHEQDMEGGNEYESSLRPVPEEGDRSTGEVWSSKRRKKVLLSQWEQRHAALVGGSSFVAWKGTVPPSSSTLSRSASRRPGTPLPSSAAELADVLCAALPEGLLYRCDLLSLGRGLAPRTSNLPHQVSAGDMDSAPKISSSGSPFVLYVMQTALRVHDNPVRAHFPATSCCWSCRLHLPIRLPLHPLGPCFCRWSVYCSCSWGPVS